MFNVKGRREKLSIDTGIQRVDLSHARIYMMHTYLRKKMKNKKRTDMFTYSNRFLSMCRCLCVHFFSLKTDLLFVQK